MPNDTGLLLDFGVRLPSPSPWGGAFLLACGHTRFHSKSKHPPQTLPPSRLGNLFDLNNFRRLLRFEITLSHRHSWSKITTAPAARKLIFRRPDRMSTGFTNMPILPRTETVCRIFHKTCPPISNTVSILENDRRLSIYLAAKVVSAASRHVWFFRHSGGSRNPEKWCELSSAGFRLSPE